MMNLSESDQNVNEFYVDGSESPNILGHVMDLTQQMGIQMYSAVFKCLAIILGSVV